MEAIQSYVLSVTSAAILCTIAQRLMGGKGSAAAIIRILCGAIMATVILKPIGNLALPDLSRYWTDLEYDISAAVAAGTEHTHQELHNRISQNTVAYIQKQAAALGMSVDVNVELDNSPIPVPVRIELSGSISPIAQKTLSELIETDIGIREEDQIWK